MNTPSQSPSLKVSPYRNLIPYFEAQARHETNNYQSRVFKELNNPYGMKVAYKRKFLGTPSNIIKEGEPYAKYKDLEQAHQDFLLWHEFSNTPTEFNTLYEYISFLKSKSYFGDFLNTYYKNVLRYYKEINSNGE